MVGYRLPVRFFLTFVAIVLVLPGLVLGGILLDQFAESERADNRADLLAATARTADAVERELGVLIMAARVLATSEYVAGGNLAAFASEARAADSVLGQSVSLIAPDGSRVLTSSRDDAADFGDLAKAELQRVVAERRPIVSGLLGQGTGRPRVIVLAPVIGGSGGDSGGDSGVVAIVGLSLRPRFFDDLLQQQSLPTGWVAVLRDTERHLIARSQDPERFAGAPPVSAPRTPVKGGNVVATETLDGIPALATSLVVPAAGWRVGVAVSREVVEEPVRRSELWLVCSGAAAVALGLMFAWQLASRISGPLSALAQAGQDLGAGRAVAPVRSVITEVQDVSAALIGAHDQLLERGAKLAAGQARLAAIIETVPVGLLIADGSGQVVAGNRQLARMLTGEQPDAEAAAACARLGAVDEAGRPVPDDQMPLPRALAGDDPAELTARFCRADGSLFWAEAVAAPFAGADGEVTGAVLALLDIDEAVRGRQQKERWADRLEAEVKARTRELEDINRQLREEVSARGRAEDQLRQAQKMDAVGRLTGGIAHDFNNLLTVIMGSLELLRRRVTDARAMRLVDSAADGANRAAELISRLLAFSRRQPLLPQRLDVNQLVIGMSTLLQRSLGETIDIETVLEDGLCCAMADPNQLESALLNLAVNARDAILETSPGGGGLRIETTSMTVEREADSRKCELRPGDYVVIATIDNGGGMSPENLAQAFEPFFTTKPHGKGTGLGLPQVYGFAAQSGGYVTMESQLGRGTTVRLFLPCARSDAVPGIDGAPRVALPSAQPGTVVLVVEDEPAVRMFAAEALRLLGYGVLEASGGEQALNMLDQHPEVALMLTDVVMPGMNGRELARAVERLRPRLPILLASGYNRAPEEPEDTRWELLPKPFTVAALATSVSDVLRQHRDRVADGDASGFDDLRVNA